LIEKSAAERLENRGADIDDPLTVLEDQNLPRNQFMLDSSSDVALVRFKKAHDIERCNARPGWHGPNPTNAGRHANFPCQNSSTVGEC
jgi:hypothetical protein